MDFASPRSLFSSPAIGRIGMGVFIDGKKQANWKCPAAGAGLCVFPYFVTSVLLMWLITAACLGGLYVTAERG